jgi:hypothetical protein
MDEILFGAQVAFGGGNGGVAEEELDLFEFAAGGAAEFGAGATEVVGLEFPSQFLAIRARPRRAGLAETAKTR